MLDKLPDPGAYPNPEKIVSLVLNRVLMFKLLQTNSLGQLL